jgi:lipopolysaccharide transport system permease protein
MLSVTTISSDQTIRFRQLLVDLWLYRDLFLAFLERDIKVRYKQTALGIIWVVIQPLITAGVFSLIFGRIMKMDIGSMPYALFYISALVPWVCFTQGLSGAAISLESNAGLVSKVYFPRLVVPGAGVVATLPDYFIGFLLINILALALGHWSFMLLLIMPLLLVLQLAAAAGIGIFFTALNAQYRDVKHLIPFMIQLGLLATPVIYPLERLPLEGQMLEMLNPMAGVVTTYRWALGGPDVPAWLLLGNGIFALVYLWGGISFFRWREAKLVDIL